MVAKSFHEKGWFTARTGWLLMATLLFISGGCTDSNPSQVSGQQTHTSAATDIYSETEYVEGIINSLTRGRTLFVELESPTGTPILEDTDITGTDVFRITLAGDTVYDLCHSGVDPDHMTFLKNQGGTTLLAWEGGEDKNRDCNSDGVEPVLLPAGEYLLEMVHGNTDSPAPDFYVIFFQDSEPASGLQTAANVSETHALTLTVQSPEPYSFDKAYEKDGTMVSYKDAIYTNKWYASKGACPVEADCKALFEAGLWVGYDPSVKHEFAYYDYEALRKEYPSVPLCTAEDYALEHVQNVIDQSAETGEISLAAPEGGFTQDDLEALYREYMLPCRPDLKLHEPDNVKRVRKLLPQSLWETFAEKTAHGDTQTKTYIDADGESVPWPAETGFKAGAYENFLKGVARYPYFCGENGYFDSADEACKRELASLFSHAAFETGNTRLEESFYWLREYGYVNGNSFFNDGCAPPLDCKTNGWARYYGRGPKQLTYFYNYAGFSASYFLGDYNFLLLWPDLVAYDGEMYFLAAIYYVMTNQPPKPSLHDVLLGRYRPSETCVTLEDCHGVQYDPVSGVKQNFDISIEIVNGGVQCRPDSKQEYKDQAEARTRAYLEMLKRLGATLTEAEESMVEGCGFITTTQSTVFAHDPLKAGLRTWIDLSEKSCRAQSRGGLATISVTATGVVEACRN